MKRTKNGKRVGRPPLSREEKIRRYWQKRAEKKQKQKEKQDKLRQKEREEKKKQREILNEEKKKRKKKKAAAENKRRKIEARLPEIKDNIVEIDGKPVDRFKYRYIIYTTLKNGTRLYYVDPLVIWSFNEYRAMQFYSKEYAQRYGGFVRKLIDEPRYNGQRKFKELQYAKVKRHYLSEKYFAENVLENRLFLIRAVRLHRKVMREKYAKQKESKQKEFKNDSSGNLLDRDNGVCADAVV